jgi:multicomponent Na+:H+ antiporter subunit B
MIRTSLYILILAGLGLIFYQLAVSYQPAGELGHTATYYAEKGPGETGAPNLVTSVIVTYRGLDTLGEITILFLTAAIIGYMLKRRKEKGGRDVRPPSELQLTGTAVLLPIITIVGIYIFINGHLSPGGGFQGGAVMASAMALMLLGAQNKRIGKSIYHITESLSGFGIVALGIAGIVLAGGFLDNTILPLGSYGGLFSAGAIPLIYSLVGLKVGAELASILISLNQTQNEEP